MLPIQKTLRDSFRLHYFLLSLASVISAVIPPASHACVDGHTAAVGGRRNHHAQYTRSTLLFLPGSTTRSPGEEGSPNSGRSKRTGHVPPHSGLKTIFRQTSPLGGRGPGEGAARAFASRAPHSPPPSWGLLGALASGWG